MPDTTIKGLTQEQISKLREPLPPEAVSPHPTKNYLSTIKVIYVVERLNEVFGIGRWYLDNRIIEKKSHPAKNGEVDMVVVESTLTVPEYGIRIPMFGGNDNEDLGDAYKGACTDALSKIGSYLYIGMDVYKGLSDKKPAPREKVTQKAPSQKPASQTAKPAGQTAKPQQTKNEPPPKPEEVPSVPMTTIRGKVSDEIKTTEKGAWIKVDNHPVYIWAFDSYVKQGLKAGLEVEIEAMVKQGNKGKYYHATKLLAVVPARES